MAQAARGHSQDQPYVSEQTNTIIPSTSQISKYSGTCTEHLHTNYVQKKDKGKILCLKSVLV